MCDGLCDSDGCEEKAVYETETGECFCANHCSIDRTESSEEYVEEKRVRRPDRRGKLRVLCNHKDENGKLCEKRPNYNIKDKKSGLFCVEHKKKGMIDVANPTCVFEDENGERCRTISFYNNKGEKKGLYCTKHKKEKMINVRSKTCAFEYTNGEQCGTRSCYNIEGNKNGLYCFEHRKKGMVNVQSKTCAFEDANGERCKIQPHYNIKNNKRGLYCFKHKEDGMVDVISITCVFEDENGERCKTIPIYNVKGEKRGLYCAKHKKEKMINVRDITCVFEDDNGERCMTIPLYNNKGEKKGLYCSKHRGKEMVDVKVKDCIICNMTSSRLSKYKGYCIRCFIHLYPEDKVSRGYKFQEQYVVSFIKEHYSNEYIRFDKQINGGCSKKRPDVMIECFTHSIIIEVDEEQHNNYSCENKRMMELFQDLGSRPIIFIRFNPDKYKDSTNKTIPSPFQYLKKGVPAIRLKKQWEERLFVLKKTTDTLLKNVPEKEVSIVYLYYDNFDSSQQNVVFEEERCDV